MNKTICFVRHVDYPEMRIEVLAKKLFERFFFRRDRPGKGNDLFGDGGSVIRPCYLKLLYVLFRLTYQVGDLFVD